MIVAGLIAFGAVLAAASAHAAVRPSDPFPGGFGFGGGGFGGNSFINDSNLSAGSGFGHGVASNEGLLGVNLLNNVGLGLLSSANGF
ncbi:hypothetical protein ACFQX6_50300 [Streptosporangium lutulentum]